MKGLMIVGDGEVAEAAIKKVRNGVRQNWTVNRASKDTNSAWLRERNELFKDLDGSKEMVQLCEKGVCKLLDAKAIDELLG